MLRIDCKGRNKCYQKNELVRLLGILGYLVIGFTNCALIKGGLS